MTPGPRAASVTRFSHWLLGFAALNLLLGNLLPVLLLETPRGETTLHHTRGFLRGEAWVDSWQPMIVASEHLERDPSAPVYSALFFERGIEFQYPVSALLPLSAVELAVPEDVPGVPTPRTQRRPARLAHALNTISWGFTLVALAASVVIFNLSLARSSRRPRSWPDRTAANAAAIALALSFYPLVKSYTLGQIQTWITALFALAFLCRLRNRDLTAGVLLGVCALIKPPFALFLVWGCLRRDWRFVAGIGAVVALGLLATTAAFGISHQLDYLRVLSFLGRHGDAYFPNQSVNGLLNRLFFNGGNLVGQGHLEQPFHPWVYAGTLLSSAALILWGLFWRGARAGRANAVDFSIMALSLTMASPIAWEHHYGILLPIYAFLAASVLERRVFGALTIPVLCSSYVLSSSYFHVTKQLAATQINVLQSYLFFGALMLLVYLYAMTRQAPPADQAPSS